MANLQMLQGNLLDAPDQYIAHQCNCVTVRSKHLAWSMFDRYPHADTYQYRTGRQDEAGTVTVCGDGKENRYILNMYAQKYPGPSKQFDDSPPIREKWFQQCLTLIGGIPGLTSIGFPHGIGCGAAGGNWERYLGYIQNFANDHPHVQVRIYRL